MWESPHLNKKKLSFWYAFMRFQANLGDGARAAAERRQQAGREEEWRRREALAHFHAHIRGRGVARAGEVFVRA